MNMQNYSDNQLQNAILDLVRREREILTDVLHHLKEVDRRKLFSKLGFQSLHDYCVRSLKYSDDQAYRRVQAMRLLRDLPQIEEKINEGALTLSNLSAAQNKFRKAAQEDQKYTKEEKLELIAKLENTTKAEAQKILRPDVKGKTYSFEANEELEKTVERLRELNPHLNFDQLIEKVCKLALEKTAPEKKIERAQVRLEKKEQKPGQSEAKSKSEIRHSTSQTKSRAALKHCDTKMVEKSSPARTQNHKQRSRYIPAPIKHAVWIKTSGRCTDCNSRHAVEYDHIIPFAIGGETTVENLRLLCRNCNFRRGVETYGANKMHKITRHNQV